MKLYDKTGKCVEVPHALDIKEWKKDGWTENNPKSKDESESSAAKLERENNAAMEKAKIELKEKEDAIAKEKEQAGIKGIF